MTIMNDTVMTMDGDALMGGPTTPEIPVAVIKVAR